jgi:branched-chain amino acid aminotransferase
LLIELINREINSFGNCKELGIMLNVSGNIIEENAFEIASTNRAFRFGDGLFETMKYNGEKLLFLEDHYFRLMGGMRVLRMEIPMEFTPEFFEGEILKTIDANNLQDAPARIRFSVFRKGEGLYSPETNDVDFWIEATPLEGAAYVLNEIGLEVDLFTDHPKPGTTLSNVKSNSCFVSILAGVFKKENNLDDCLLINQNHQLVEGISSNLFFIQGKKILTPTLKSGCVKGVMRRIILDNAANWGYEVEEGVYMPFELMKSDGVFLANTIKGIQWIGKYKKKTFEKTAVAAIFEKLNESLEA